MAFAGNGGGVLDVEHGWLQSIGVCTVGGGDQKGRLDLLV